MSLKFNFHLGLVLLLGFCSFESAAQESANPNTNQRPTAVANRVESGPVIDGNIKKDAFWQAIEIMPAMIQQQPNSGEAPSEKTEVRIAYDDVNFYISAVCYDSDPSGLVVPDARRDAAQEGADAFMFILDTYQDRQNGFVFGSNFLGLAYDAQVDNEGIGNFNNNRQQGGVIGGLNVNWDANWEVETEVDEDSWSVEFAIPFKNLRFKSGPQSWGFNYRRNIRKNNEIDYWAELPIQFDHKRLSLAGNLEGLDLKRPGNLKLIPYVLGQTSRDYQDDTQEKAEFNGEAGLDLKYSLTANLTLDLTYNTDFAQVEVDEQQVNLDRFNLFFPEKRPFFLENAGLFTVGSTGEIDLFFSRRIGLADDGTPIPIIGGGRLSGKVNKTNVGFLSMWTDAVDDGENSTERNNYTMARVNHQLASRSTVGAALISRQGESGDYNRVMAVDTRIGIGKKAQLVGYYANSNTPGIEGDDYSFKLEAGYDWNGWILNTSYTELAEGFNPEVGFLARPSFKKVQSLVLYNWRFKENKFKMLQVRPHVSYRGYWDFAGFQQTGFLHVDNHWVFMDGGEIHTGVNFTKEGVREEFALATDRTVPVGTFDNTEAQIVFITNPSKPLSLSSRHVIGGFFDGKRSAHSGNINLRIGDKLNTQFGFVYNDVSLESGDFEASIFRSRIAYSFTPKISAQSLIQHNSTNDRTSANIRFGWLQQANAGLFLVYNQLREPGNILNQSFTIKYSYLIDAIR